MNSYAIWNNKGGVGKSFLTFAMACEYAHLYPDTDVYVIDLCPQANISEMLLTKSEFLNELFRQPIRASIAGYIEARLNSPFRMVPDASPYVCHPHDYNKNIPANLHLVCGDQLLEIIAEAIRQTSQLVIPVDAWKQVLSWVRDLRNALRQLSGNRETLFCIDCNPGFAVYTQLALVAADYIIVPFTADDSSRRAIENVVALLYGYGINDPKTESYARINFVQKAHELGVDVPKLHTFVNNRVILWGEKPNHAFEAINKTIKQTMG